MSKRLRLAVFLSGLAVFVYLFIEAGPGEIVERAARMGWWIVPILAIWSVMYLCNAAAFRAVLGDAPGRPRFGALYSLTVTGFALNYITPLINLGGEPYRMAILREKVGTHRAVSTVILYNMVRMLSHFVFWLAAILLVIVAVPIAPEYTPALVVVSLVVILLGVFFLSRHRKGIFRSLLDFLQRKRLLRRLALRLEPRRAGLLLIDEQIMELYQLRRSAFYGALFLELAARIIGSLEFFFIAASINVPISFADALYINAASSLILNLLFFIPYEVGAREGGLYLVVKSLGMAPGIGVYMGLVNRVRELFWILIGLGLMQFGGRAGGPRAQMNLMKERADEGSTD